METIFPSHSCRSVCQRLASPGTIEQPQREKGRFRRTGPFVNVISWALALLVCSDVCLAWGDTPTNRPDSTPTSRNTPSLRAEPFPPASPQFIAVDENQLLLEGLPGTPSLTPVSLARASEFFAAVGREGIEGRYIIGSCEDRAHLIALMAHKAGLPVGKVWAIAPARYTLLSRELFRVSDPSGVTDNVLWGHHVAPVLRVDHGDGNVRNVVIDLAFNTAGYLSLQEWTGRLGSPRGLFFFSDVNAWLFKSLDDLIVWDNRPANDPNRLPTDPPTMRMPRWMPNILTGDFMTYDPGVHDRLIAAGMAQDDVAMRIFSNLPNYSAAESAVLKGLIRSEDGISKIMSETQIMGLSAETRRELNEHYQTRVAHWVARLAALNS
jgi:hypothetical protein